MNMRHECTDKSMIQKSEACREQLLDLLKACMMSTKYDNIFVKPNVDVMTKHILVLLDLSNC